MKILRKIKDFFSAVLFGMKAGDEMMTTSQVEMPEGSGIHKQIEHKSVLRDLLKGEVTQEVEELRYETFKAEEMSNEYHHIGNGIAIKNKGDKATVTKKRKKFVQYNVSEEYSLNECFDMLKEHQSPTDLPTRKIFKATYKNGVRFKLELYTAKVKVDLTGDAYKTYLYFVDDKMNSGERALVNFIKKTKKEVDAIIESGNENKLRSYKERNELYSELETFKFTTINASNDVPNGIDYKFREATLEGIEQEDGYIVLVYSWKYFDGNVLLSERFKSKSAEEKFKTKTKRKGYIPQLQPKSTKPKTPSRNRKEWSDDQCNII